MMTATIELTAPAYRRHDSIRSVNVNAQYTVTVGGESKRLRCRLNAAKNLAHDMLRSAGYAGPAEDSMILVVGE